MEGGVTPVKEEGENGLGTLRLGCSPDRPGQSTRACSRSSVSHGNVDMARPLYHHLAQSLAKATSRRK